MHNTINISPFFIIYSFYFNIPFTVKDNRLKEKVPITREIVKKFKSEDKELTKR
jgi:hypothetical protein